MKKFNVIIPIICLSVGSCLQNTKQLQDGVMDGTRRVFVTSATENGAFNNGTPDDFCASVANSQNFVRNYVAIVSTSVSDAKSNIVPDSDGPVYKIDANGNSTLVAATVAAMWSGGLQSGIDLTEAGGTLTGATVFTGTTAAGVADLPASSDATDNICNNWGDAATINGRVAAGTSGSITSSWINTGTVNKAQCNSSAHVYCISQ